MNIQKSVRGAQFYNIPKKKMNGGEIKNFPFNI